MMIYMFNIIIEHSFLHNKAVLSHYIDGWYFTHLWKALACPHHLTLRVEVLAHKLV